MKVLSAKLLLLAAISLFGEQAFGQICNKLPSPPGTFAEATTWCRDQGLEFAQSSSEMASCFAGSQILYYWVPFNRDQSTRKFSFANGQPIRGANGQQLRGGRTQCAAYLGGQGEYVLKDCDTGNRGAALCDSDAKLMRSGREFSDCTGNIRNTEYGTGDYSPDVRESWSLGSTDPNAYFLISFVNTTTEPEYDVVAVWDLDSGFESQGNVPLNRFAIDSDESGVIGPTKIDSANILITFTSDGDTQYDGFSLNYRRVDSACPSPV